MTHFGKMATFIPSGPDFEKAKQFFAALGFETTWSNDEYVGLQRGDCAFILQKYDAPDFAANLMVRVPVADLDALWREIQAGDLISRFGIKANPPHSFPWGATEIHLIDPAGVCWHFADLRPAGGQ